LGRAMNDGQPKERRLPCRRTNPRASGVRFSGKNGGSAALFWSAARNPPLLALSLAERFARIAIFRA
jgi:hypothetical protein